MKTGSWSQSAAPPTPPPGEEHRGYRCRARMLVHSRLWSGFAWVRGGGRAAARAQRSIPAPPGGRPIVGGRSIGAVVVGSAVAARKAAKFGSSARNGSTVVSSSSSPARCAWALDRGRIRLIGTVSPYGQALGARSSSFAPLEHFVDRFAVPGLERRRFCPKAGLALINSVKRPPGSRDRPL
jgi:hypothetical protein